MYYYHGTDGEPFTDATMHDTRTCGELKTPVRPVAESSIDDNHADLCPACHPLAGGSDSGGDNSGMGERDTQQLIEAGECPWCDDYEGDHVGQHASAAHADEWEAYQAEGDS